MNRINKLFKEKRDKILSIYFTAGYPSLNDTTEIIKILDECGVDLIEIGMPFSDPIADGPVIQNASTISLQKGTNVSKFFNIVKKIRKETEIPLVLMTYTNILHRMGYDKFIKDAKKAGIDGFILPDMSLEESKEYLDAAKNNADTIFLISPNTTKTRIDKISKISTGFLYLVAVFGTTGVKTSIKNYTLKAIKNVKKQTKGKIPVGIGFGVSTPEDVKRYIKAGADAVIVGSAYLKLIEKTKSTDLESKITSFTKSLKKQTILQ